MSKLEAAVARGESVEMENYFSRLALDIIGKAVFNYNFDSLTHDDPLIKAVYTVLREAEHRSIAALPYWDIPGISYVLPNQRKVVEALQLINGSLDELIAKCKVVRILTHRSRARDASSPGPLNLQMRKLPALHFPPVLAGHARPSSLPTLPSHPPLSLLPKPPPDGDGGRRGIRGGVPRKAGSLDPALPHRLGRAGLLQAAPG